MADFFGRKEAIDEAERDAVEGDKPKADHCKEAREKVERQPEGSSRRRIAERQLAECRARQTTDSNNE